MSFLTAHLLEILFSLLSAGALALCGVFGSKVKKYKKMVNEQEKVAFDETIEEKVKPILEEIEELRKYIREVKEDETHKLGLIISSYRYRLVQLCKIYLRQGYITEEQYEQLSELYNLYSSLGGNGQAKEYYERTISLGPPRDPSENDKK